jgi:hypothetical protein
MNFISRQWAPSFEKYADQIKKLRSDAYVRFLLEFFSYLNLSQ